MGIVLDKYEQRVLGCLLEKSVVTPDQYPLTLNSLVNACNQKSARSPVMSLESGEVQRAVRSLQDKHLVRSEENFKSQVEKFDHRFCNTPFSDFQFDSAQYAAVCVLLLRGPRTPGEIRANSGRLHTFADNGEVVSVLESLIDIEKGPLVVKLPRTPGRKDSEYQHLFGDLEVSAVDTEASQESDREPAVVSGPSRVSGASLEARIDELEDKVRVLEAQLHELLS